MNGLFIHAGPGKGWSFSFVGGSENRIIRPEEFL